MPGLIAAALAGGVEGLGLGAAAAGKEQRAADFEKQKSDALAQREQNLERLRFQHEGSLLSQRETVRQAGRQADINQDVSPDNVAARAKAVVMGSELTLPSEVARKTALGAVDTQQKLDEFTKLAPLKRQEEIATAVETLRAMSTPQAIASTRAIAQAKHIVDPSYTLVPNADGTVTTFDSHSGKSTGVLTNPDGKPVMRKDPEELKAASSVINMAAANLKIAQAEHKATMADVTADPATKAAANAAWKNAQTEAERLTAPAYAVLFGKSGATAVPSSATPAAQPTPADISDLKKFASDPRAIALFNSHYGDGAAEKILGAKPAETKPNGVSTPRVDNETRNQDPTLRPGYSLLTGNPARGVPRLRADEYRPIIGRKLTE